MCDRCIVECSDFQSVYVLPDASRYEQLEIGMVTFPHPILQMSVAEHREIWLRQRRSKVIGRLEA